MRANTPRASMSRLRWLALGLGLALSGVLALVAVRRRHAPGLGTVASTGTSASAAAVMSAPPTASVQKPQVLEFSFDCAGLPSTPATCPGASPLAAKLVESALWAVTSVQQCGNALKGERASTAARALSAAQVLAREPLPALERALLQNAALRLLSCSVNGEKESERQAITRNAKRLIKAFALNATELAALPKSGDELAWLGDASRWQVGSVRTHLHEASDGYVSTVERAKYEQEFATIYRPILLNAQGEPQPTDLVSKLILRRPAAEAGRFSVCIATLDPVSAHCNSATLRPVSQELRSEALEVNGRTPVCHHCHVMNHANSLGFGPALGLGPETVTMDLARASLSKVLAP